MLLSYKNLICGSALLITSCTSVQKEAINNINFQLIPEGTTVNEVKNIQFSYIVPTYLKSFNNAEDAFNFSILHTGPEYNQKRIIIKKKKNSWTIEKRNDNGTAGSGCKYEIDVLKEKLSQGTKVTFIVKNEKKYQEGLILTFAVPNFDIEQYLSSPTIDYKFELNSKFDIPSVEANFKRLLEERSEHEYYTDGSSFKSSNRVKFYPYRGGTKIQITSTISLQNKGETLNLNTITDEMQKIMSKVVHN